MGTPSKSGSYAVERCSSHVMAQDFGVAPASLPTVHLDADRLDRMVILRHHVHARGLSMEMKEKVYVKRKIDKKPFLDIASEVWNLKKERPYWKVVRAAFREFSTDRNQKKKDKYANCGRKKILTKVLIKWLIKKMKELRHDADCTSTDLQMVLAQGLNPTRLNHILKDLG